MYKPLNGHKVLNQGEFTILLGIGQNMKLEFRSIFSEIWLVIGYEFVRDCLFYKAYCLYNAPFPLQYSTIDYNLIYDSVSIGKCLDFYMKILGHCYSTDRNMNIRISKPQGTYYFKSWTLEEGFHCIGGDELLGLEISFQISLLGTLLTLTVFSIPLLFSLRFLET